MRANNYPLQFSRKISVDSVGEVGWQQNLYVCLRRYCASRVLKYSNAGQLIGVFGVGDSQIPHSLALAEDLDLLCVADRENMRYNVASL